MSEDRSDEPAPSVAPEPGTPPSEPVNVEPDTPFDAPEMRSIIASIDYDVDVELGE